MIVRSIFLILAAFTAPFLAGCATSDAQLAQSGHNQAYIQGFHDGRHSGMKEAGNYFEHIVKDTGRFADDADYQAGWLEGETEGKRIQQQANAASGAGTASSVGKAVDNAQPHPKKIANEAMKGVDTGDFKALESN